MPCITNTYPKALVERRWEQLVLALALSQRRQCQRQSPPPDLSSSDLSSRCCCPALPPLARTSARHSDPAREFSKRSAQSCTGQAFRTLAESCSCSLYPTFSPPVLPAKLEYLADSALGNVCMYICMHVCICTYVSVLMYVHVYVHVPVHVCLYVYVCIYIYILCIYIYIYVRVYL